MDREDELFFALMPIALGSALILAGFLVLTGAEWWQFLLVGAGCEVWGLFKAVPLWRRMKREQTGEK